MSKPTLSLKTVLNENTKGKALSDEDIRRLQQCMVTCAGELLEVCEKHGIKLILCGGSCLGYVRHGGFIPWDDDVDFALLRDDYEKLISVFEDELSDRYVMSAPKPGFPSYNRFVQLFRKGTVLTNGEDDRSGRPQTVYIDIFPIDFTPKGVFARRLKGLHANLLMAIGGCVSFTKYMTPEEKKTILFTKNGRLLYGIRWVVGKLFSWRDPKRWFEVTDSCIANNRQSDFMTIAPGRRHYIHETIPANAILPLKPAKFEGLDVYAMNDPDVYLTNLYGDYMTIPPTEKRERHFATKVVTLQQ